MKKILIIFVSLLYLNFVGCEYKTKNTDVPTEKISSFVFFQSHDLNKFCENDYGCYAVAIPNIGIFRCKNGVLNDWRGLPSVQFSDGTIMYFNSGKLHKSYGPAIIWEDGRVEYYSNGKRHREDGPAVIFFNKGSDIFDFTKEYWINGVQYTEKEYYNIF